jgi:hypothetical protein
MPIGEAGGVEGAIGTGVADWVGDGLADDDGVRSGLGDGLVGVGVGDGDGATGA